MADAVNTYLYDGIRNCQVTVVDVSDGTGLANYVAINASTLVPNPGAHMKIRRIRYSITNMVVTLKWDGGTPANIAYLGQGEDILDWSLDYSGGLQNTAVTPTGNILISATTFGSATAGFTITLEMIKGV